MKDMEKQDVKPALKSSLVDPVQVKPLLNEKPMMGMKKTQSAKLFVAVFVVLAAVALGVGTGWVFARKVSTSGSSDMVVNSSKSVDTQTEAGINDDSAFPSIATGVLQSGGIRGEGTHHLDRSATHEQDAALSSTVINLDNFVGKKVEIHGQTISSKTSGWLMDVGKIKIVE